VILLAVDDDILEYDELLTMTIMIPDQLMKIGVLLGDVNMTTVNITDNDSKNYLVMHVLFIYDFYYTQGLQQACHLPLLL